MPDPLRITRSAQAYAGTCSCVSWHVFSGLRHDCPLFPTWWRQDSLPAGVPLRLTSVHWNCFQNLRALQGKGGNGVGDEGEGRRWGGWPWGQAQGKLSSEVIWLGKRLEG